MPLDIFFFISSKKTNVGNHRKRKKKKFFFYLGNEIQILTGAKIKRKDQSNVVTLW